MVTMTLLLSNFLVAEGGMVAKSFLAREDRYEGACAYGLHYYGCANELLVPSAVSVHLAECKKQWDEGRPDVALPAVFWLRLYATALFFASKYGCTHDAALADQIDVVRSLLQGVLEQQDEETTDVRLRAVYLEIRTLLDVFAPPVVARRAVNAMLRLNPDMHNELASDPCNTCLAYGCSLCVYAALAAIAVYFTGLDMSA